MAPNPEPVSLSSPFLNMNFRAPPGLEVIMPVAAPTALMCSPMKIHLDPARYVGSGLVLREAPNASKENQITQTKTLSMKSKDQRRQKTCLPAQRAAYAESAQAGPCTVPMRPQPEKIDGSRGAKPEMNVRDARLANLNLQLNASTTNQEAEIDKVSPKGNSIAKSNTRGKIHGGKHETKVGDARLFSSLLQCNELSLWDVLPCLSAVAKDPVGSSFLEEQLPQASTEVLAMVVGAALQDLVPLSMHEYGHSFVLHMLEVATQEQKQLLGQGLSPQVKLLARDPHGCRVVQRALQVLPHDDSQQLIAGLKESMAQCMKDRHANHVLQVFIEEMPPASVAFIIDAVESCGADQLALQRFACRILKRLFEQAEPEQMQKAFNQILPSVAKLAQDRYGNYVLQHVLEHGDVTQKRQVLCEVLRCGVASLASQRYGHNIVMKCIEIVFHPSNKTLLETERLALTSELLGQEEGRCAGYISVELATCKYGALVVQCLMDNIAGSLCQKVKSSSGHCWELCPTPLREGSGKRHSEAIISAFYQ